MQTLDRSTVPSGNSSTICCFSSRRRCCPGATSSPQIHTSTLSRPRWRKRFASAPAADDTVPGCP